MRDCLAPVASDRAQTSHDQLATVVLHARVAIG